MVRTIKRIRTCRKIGHAGTLDPLASGLLIIALGKATRLLQYLPTEPKKYTFTIQFGSETDTLDAEGAIIHADGPIPSEKKLRAALPSFVGLQKQMPPAFSAVKINGVRAYKLARNGTPPDLAARPVTIYSLDLCTFHETEGSATCCVSCSGGTYVRSLARDIARSMGTFGYAAKINRTAIGIFSLDHAQPFAAIDTTNSGIISFRQAFAASPQIEATDAMLRSISFGKDITGPVSETHPDSMHLLFSGKELHAVLKRVRGTVFHPVIVFSYVEGIRHADT